MANAKCRIKADDTVVVIAGKDKGKVGRVLRVLPTERRVVVDGVARVKRHQRPTGDQPGAIIEKEASIDVSNVALWNADENRRVKVGYSVVEGKKIRIDRATGAAIDG
ncbi:MAG: 50S ribosomal protein L24 [Proteobacteria bacterium]|nr:50S ribosomal protein L24 [Pseudomonadota bacterium]